MFINNSLHIGIKCALVSHLVDLVHGENLPRALWQQRQQGRIPCRPLTRLDHHDDDINFAQRLSHDAVHHAVERAAVPSLEAWGIDKYKLLVTPGENTKDAMTSRLRLARHDADLGAH